VSGNLRKVFNLIGIAQRAGKASSGTMAVRASLVKKRACILLMSHDIAENTRDILVHSCIKTGIPWLILGTRQELGNSLGKANRVALTINDAGMAGAIVKAVQTANEEAKSMGVV
jgi:ribosomal protein L7Ae-like RNA K-turn-binding protein